MGWDGMAREGMGRRVFPIMHGREGLFGCVHDAGLYYCMYCRGIDVRDGLEIHTYGEEACGRMSGRVDVESEGLADD